MNEKQVRNALDDLKAKGTVYIKSKHIAAEMDASQDSGTLSAIGAVLNERIVPDRDDVELWTDGGRSYTWRLECDA